MKSIKLVTLDATNTVLQFRVPPWHFYSVVAKEYGYDVKEDVLKIQMKESFKTMNDKYPNFGKTNVNWEFWWRELVKLTFRGQLPKTAVVDSIATKLINDFKTDRCWTVADGSCKLLDILKSKSITTGVISNFDPRLNEVLQNVGLHRKFDFVLTSYDVGISKPDNRIFSCAIKMSNENLKPCECLHIGDDLEKDYNGARAAGWHALLIASKANETPPASEHVFPNIVQLALAIENDMLKL